jgi:hypothetical protein
MDKKKKNKGKVGEIIIHNHTIQKFMKYEKDFANLLALYTFYNYHAQLQKTNTPLATNDFVKKGLGWSMDRIKRVKRILKELKLIEVVRKGKYYYVYLPFIYTKKKIKDVIKKYKDKFKKREEENNLNVTKKEDKTKEEPKKEKQQKQDLSEDEKNSPLIKELVKNGVNKNRAHRIRNMILSIEDFDKYNAKFDFRCLAKWIAYCEKNNIRYNRGNLRSWIIKMANLFGVEQVHMIRNSIKMSLKDLRVPRELKYIEYKGRSVKIEGKVYKNLTEVFYVDGIYIYEFDGKHHIKSRMDIEDFFNKFEYWIFEEAGFNIKVNSM